MADSSTGGYLQPNNLPSADKLLHRVLHGYVVGVTGLLAGNVRPRWQKNPPEIPASNVDWCAFGVTEISGGHPYQVQIKVDDDSFDTKANLVRDELLTCQASFYGENSGLYAERLVLGSSIAQNREALYLQGFSVISATTILRSAELVNDVWLDRQDIEIIFGRRVVVEYNVLHFLGAAETMETETAAESWSVEG